jgi:hypothetical protein
MSVSPVSSIGTAFVAAANKVSSGSVSPTVSAAIEEANESKATTVKEAQNGDPVAKRKLQKLQAAQQQQQQEAAPPTEPGKGAAIDKAA